MTFAAHLLQAQPLPTDPMITVGTLENGLTYFVRQNSEPQDRAELRLVVNAGSVLEDEDQLGMAHFVEHMLFNGTVRFPKQDLIDFFELAGMTFGPDVNAYTSFDETVYMLEVPTDSQDVLRTGFAVLREWASNGLFDRAEIEAERGVILEEWRARLGAQSRILEKTLPLVLRDSQYAQRLPIGDTLTINNGTPEALTRFYKTWYRPDLMAVVVVGDLPVETSEALIRQYFDDWAAEESPVPRPTFHISTSEETHVKVITDPETPTVLIEVGTHRPSAPARTITDIRRRLVGLLARGMLNRRFAEIARDGTSAPFLWARATTSKLIRPLKAYTVACQVAEDSLISGFRAMMLESKRALDHGFTEGELARQKRQLLRAFEREANEHDTTPSRTHAWEMVQHYLTQAPIMGPTYMYEVAQSILPQITLQEANRALEFHLQGSGRLVVATLPERDDLTPPSEEDLLAVLHEIDVSAPTPYVDTDSDLPLIGPMPPGGKVVEVERIESLDVTMLTLSNGPRVVLKPTDYKNDEILLQASSPGGSSLADDDHYLNATLADILVKRSGVGDFDRSALVKKLTGHMVSVTPVIGALSEGFSARAAPADLEIMFQLIYLYATQPRLDESAIVYFQNHQRAMLANREALPSSVFHDTLLKALFPDDPRHRPLTAELLDGIDRDAALRFYRDRFADMGDFTFILVGNFDPNHVRGLAERYLGALPATGRNELWVDRSRPSPKGTITRVVRKGLEERAQTVLAFHGAAEYSHSRSYLLKVLVRVLDIRLREELREARSGVYSASVNGALTKLPKGKYSINIFFGSAPDRVEELTQVVFDEIKAIQTDLDLTPYLEKTKAQYRRDHETGMEQNSFWAGALKGYIEDDALNLEDIPKLINLLDHIDTDHLRQAANQYLTDQYVKVVLLPENAQPAGSSR